MTKRKKREAKASLLCLLRDIMPAFHTGILVHADAQRGAEADKVDEAGKAAPAFIVADGLQGDVTFFGEPAAADVLRDAHGAHIAADLAGVNLEHGRSPLSFVHGS